MKYLTKVMKNRLVIINKEIYPGQFEPSLTHRFIRVLEQQGKLLRNYTQNIDTLETVAGIERVVQCHGSFKEAFCCECRHRVSCEQIREDIFAERIPKCPVCPPSAVFPVMKPGIVFFGESLPPTFDDAIEADQQIADLLIVIGSSLRVRPVNLIPHSVAGNIPQILINRDCLSHLDTDIDLLGDADYVVQELCVRLGAPFTQLCPTNRPALTRIEQLPELQSGTQQEPAEHVMVPKGQTAIVGDGTSTIQQQTDHDQVHVGHDAAGPAAKRVCLEESTSDTAVEVKTPAQTVMYNSTVAVSVTEPMTQTNVRRKLDTRRIPSDSYLFVPPNKSCFVGAELYLDANGAVCNRAQGQRKQEGDASDTDSDEQASDSGSVQLPLSLALSLPASPTSENEEYNMPIRPFSDSALL